MNEFRWIVSSVNKHFYDILNPLGITHFLESYDHNIDQLDQFCEVRFDGPHKLTKRQSVKKYDLQINALGLSVINNENIFKHQNLMDNINKCFVNCIIVYEFDNIVGGDVGKPIFGYLKRQEEVRLQNFAKVSNETEIIQSALEADYILEQ